MPQCGQLIGVAGQRSVTLLLDFFGCHMVHPTSSAHGRASTSRGKRCWGAFETFASFGSIVSQICQSTFVTSKKDPVQLLPSQYLCWVWYDGVIEGHSARRHPTTPYRLHGTAAQHAVALFTTAHHPRRQNVAGQPLHPSACTRKDQRHEYACHSTHSSAPQPAPRCPVDSSVALRSLPTSVAHICGKRVSLSSPPAQPRRRQPRSRQTDNSANRGRPRTVRMQVSSESWVPAEQSHTGHARAAPYPMRAEPWMFRCAVVVCGTRVRPLPATGSRCEAGGHRGRKTSRLAGVRGAQCGTGQPRLRKRGKRSEARLRDVEGVGGGGGMNWGGGGGSSNPTQHAKGRTGDCPGLRKETTTRRNVTRGGSDNKGDGLASQTRRYRVPGQPPAQPASGGGCLPQPRWAVCATPAVRGKSTYGGRPGQRVEEQGTWASQKHSEAGYGRPVDRGVWTAKTVKRPRQQPAHPQYTNYWAPLTRKRHTPPHPAQPQHTNYWAPRTRKRHQQEHRPQRPTESSDPTQHAKGRTGDRPGPRKETTTRRNVTRGGGGIL